MAFNRKLKTIFGEIAELYEKSRPDYPKELFKDLIKISSIKKDSKILDVGCGSGKATIQFANLGYNLIGLDISRELIKIAKRNSTKNVKYVIGSFEKTKLPKNYFDLIISAQAFHWLNPEIAYFKSYNILRSKGYLIIFWNFQKYNNKPFLKSIRNLFKKECPNFPTSKPHSIRKYKLKLKSAGFKAIKRKQYNRNIKYKKTDYLRFLESHSWVNSLEKNNLFFYILYSYYIVS